MVHFNLLIHGSKGGLVGHHLVQSDCPAQGDKGKLRCASNMEALFLKSCHFCQCVIRLDVLKSNIYFLLVHFVKCTEKLYRLIIIIFYLTQDIFAQVSSLWNGRGC